MIRSATPDDQPAIWDILRPVFRAGETYAIDPEISRDAALSHWMGGDHRVFVAERDARIVGTFYIRPNQQGGGAHVANCGFVTSPKARGRGVAREMLAHALETARQMRFCAMQFNFVVETNETALYLWRQAGFSEVGRLPRAFRHPTRGFVDALVLYKTL